jgi:hypothetical protein
VGVVTPLERAQGYAAIFISVGGRWANYLPVDASLRQGPDGPVVYLQGIQMRPVGDGWELTSNGMVSTVRPKEKAA